MTVANSDIKHIWDEAGRIMGEIHALERFVATVKADDTLTERETNALNTCFGRLDDAVTELDAASVAVRDI